jgi:hypothetical protein
MSDDKMVIVACALQAIERYGDPAYTAALRSAEKLANKAAARRHATPGFADIAKPARPVAIGRRR